MLPNLSSSHMAWLIWNKQPARVFAQLPTLDQFISNFQNMVASLHASSLDPK